MGGGKDGRGVILSMYNVDQSFCYCCSGHPGGPAAGPGGGATDGAAVKDAQPGRYSQPGPPLPQSQRIRSATFNARACAVRQTGSHRITFSAYACALDRVAAYRVSGIQRTRMRRVPGRVAAYQVSGIQRVHSLYARQGCSISG